MHDAENGFPIMDTSFSEPYLTLDIHKVGCPEGIPIIFIPCKTINGEFTIEIGIKET